MFVDEKVLNECVNEISRALLQADVRFETVAVEGVDRFRNQEGCDLIVVDTSGRHRQEAALLEEMRQVADATRPDLVVLVMDASIGQAAFEQAQAFRHSAPVGAVIVTKTHGRRQGYAWVFIGIPKI
jgi:signal recognition particle GTPase